jgi:hypothetical protein
MPLLPYGEFKPDVADYEGAATQNILNVLPRGDGYGPFPDFTNFSAALPAACRGGFYALNSDGTVTTFAGTIDRIYRLNNTDQTWVPVSKVANVSSITNASPAVVNYTAHGFVANDPVVFSTSGTLPTGLTAGTVYYVMSAGLTANAFQISATAGGSAINTSSAGSGTHSVTALYSQLSSTAQWRFAQFNNFVIAVQANVAPQVFDLSTSSAFADLGGSPPQAAYVDIVGRFVVLSGLLSNPYRIQWSGLNATTTWTSGVNSSDFQDLPDGGIVRGVAGGEYGTIFQDQAIRRMIYAPGSAVIFQIERITQDKGLYAPYSVIRAGDKIFFHSAHGFHVIEPGALPRQIGRERVDRTFFTDLDKGNLQLFMGASDPRSSRVYWAYKSNNGISNLYDSILGYDYALDRWFQVMMSGEYLLGISQNGLTLENLDAISASLDALTASLDSYATSVTPEISQFSSTHRLGFFRGSNLEATAETSEQGTDGQRIFVKGFRPITDAATVYGSCSSRDTQQASVTDGTEVLISSRTGRCDLRKSTRYSRLKVRIPAATSWTFNAGVEPDISPEGMQ